MRQKIIFVILGLLVILLVGCASDTTETTNTDNNEIVSQETQQPEIETQKETKQDSNFEEKKGILTDTVTFGEGDSFYGEIKKHKTSKTAEVEALFAFNDTEEVTDFMGKEMYMAPMMVNMMCRMMNLGVFDPEELERIGNELEDLSDSLNENSESTKGEKPQKDSEMWDYLEGYEVTKLSITFIDAEDKTQIAKCASTGKDSMQYVAYRKYDPEKSFFGSEIGVFEE